MTALTFLTTFLRFAALSLLFGMSHGIALADNTTVAREVIKRKYPYVLKAPRNVFHKGKTYKFPTYNTSMRWREIERNKLALPVIEVANNQSLILYSWSSAKGPLSSTRTIAPATRGRFYHNGIMQKDKMNRYYYQMIEVLPGGKEVIAGWVSGGQLVSPMSPSLMTTQANTNCGINRSCGPTSLNSFEILSKQLSPFVTQGRQPMNEPVQPQAYKYACPISYTHDARLTDRFNPKRKHPVLNIVRAHKGIDFGPDVKKGGGPLYSLAGGKVISSGITGGFGRQVVVETKEGWVFSYNHLATNCPLPGLGKKVTRAEKLGCMGATGLSTGTHLHLEMFRSRADYEKKNAINPYSIVDFAKACKGHYSVKKGV